MLIFLRNLNSFERQFFCFATFYPTLPSNTEIIFNVDISSQEENNFLSASKIVHPVKMPVAN